MEIGANRHATIGLMVSTVQWQLNKHLKSLYDLGSKANDCKFREEEEATPFDCTNKQTDAGWVGGQGQRKQTNQNSRVQARRQPDDETKTTTANPSTPFHTQHKRPCAKLLQPQQQQRKEE